MQFSVHVKSAKHNCPGEDRADRNQSERGDRSLSEGPSLASSPHLSRKRVKTYGREQQCGRKLLHGREHHQTRAGKKARRHQWQFNGEEATRPVLLPESLRRR